MRSLAAGLAVLILAACTAGDGHSSMEESMAEEAAEEVIRVGPELEMVRIGEDETGCPMYQPRSDTLMVIQAIHYRRADGTFTLDRSEADCPPREATDGAG